MTKISKYADTVQAYNSAIDNVSANIQQDRSLHLADLTNIYMEAALTDAPAPVMSLLEQVITDRDTFSQRKLVLDAAELTQHEQKLSRALGDNVGTLAGGSRDLIVNNHEAKKAMAYAAERSNALLYNMYKKLSHDRSIHEQELNNIYLETMKVSGRNNFTSMIEHMMDDRKTYNSRKMALDAGLWAQVENFAKDNIGSGVLRAGADVELSGGAKKRRHRKIKAGDSHVPMNVGGQSFMVPPPQKASKHGFFMTCGKKNERFENAAAADTWRTLMAHTNVQCGPVTHRK